MDDGTIVRQVRRPDRTMSLIECSSYFKLTTGRWVKLKHGPEVFFHANGRPSKTLIYEQDEPDGREIKWHDTGFLSKLTVRENQAVVFAQSGSAEGRLLYQSVKRGPNQVVSIYWNVSADWNRSGRSPHISVRERDPVADLSHTVNYNLSGLRHGEEYRMKNGVRSGKRIYWKDGVQTR